MAGLHVRSALVTGANRGIGLGLVRHLLGLPNPPKWVFAACRDPEGQRAQVRPGWDAAGCAGDGGTGQQVGEEKGLAKGWSCSRALAAQGQWQLVRAGTTEPVRREHGSQSRVLGARRCRDGAGATWALPGKG